MKKQLILGSLCFALIGATMLGCNKECYQDPTIVRDDSEQYPLNYSVVRFNTIEAYEQFIEQTSDERRERFFDSMNVNGFKNYFTNSEHLSEFAITDDGIITDDLMMDDFLGQLLNEHGIINIGKHLFRVDMPNEKVYVLPFAKDDNYSQAVAKLTETRISSDEVIVFSTSDDVLDEIRDIDKPEARKKRKCDAAAGFNRKMHKPYEFGPTGATLDFQAQYLKSGIYYSVHIRARQTPTYNGIYLATHANLKFEVHPDANNWKAIRMRRRPCNKVHATYHHGGMRDFNKGWNSKLVGNTMTKSWKGYEGTRALNGYKVLIRGYMNGNLLQSDWIGREVNSYF